MARQRSPWYAFVRMRARGTISHIGRSWVASGVTFGRCMWYARGNILVLSWLVASNCSQSFTNERLRHVLSQVRNERNLVSQKAAGMDLRGG